MRRASQQARATEEERQARPARGARSRAALTPGEPPQTEYMLERNRGALPRWSDDRFILVSPALAAQRARFYAARPRIWACMFRC